MSNRFQEVTYHQLVRYRLFKTHAVTYQDALDAGMNRQGTVNRGDAWQLFKPYVGNRLGAQLKAVVPLAIYLALFQWLFLQQPIVESGLIVAGLLAVIVGLMLFMEGLRLGLMPFGEIIGHRLPQKATLSVVLTVAFLLGIGVTFAEPAIGALQAVGQQVDPQQAPMLYVLLNHYALPLVLVVGVGVGVAAVLGTLRFVYGWSLKPLIFLTLTPVLLLSVWVGLHPQLSSTLGLAWDCGAVTTGPVTVPLVLALGIGIAAATSRGDQSLSGFGIVTLASLFPILAVLLLSVYVLEFVGIEAILTQVQWQSLAQTTAAATQLTGFDWSQSPWNEMLMGVRAIVPLILFLFLVYVVFVREPLDQPKILLVGIGFAVVGMVIFNLGLTYGLSKLGAQAGGYLPGSFAAIDAVPASPLYWVGLGLALVVLFAFVLGLGATLAEPALNALGETVERLTNGAFQKRTLMLAVAVGVGIGIAVGVMKTLFDWSLIYLLLPGYGLALVLTLLSDEGYVNVAWDSAGVTTGPVTVPLVLAMGVGIGGAVNAVEGFGILAMASIGPIVTVMLTGLWVNYRQNQLSNTYSGAKK